MRRRVTGRFELPIPAAEAIGFFTAEGERSWAPGWDPTYPAGEPTEFPGTVFITTHGNVETIWVIEQIDREAGTAAYARITPGHHAGTVRVRCDDQPDNRCVVTVEYDMTALPPHRQQILDAYTPDSFTAMLTEWEDRVTAALQRRA